MPDVPPCPEHLLEEAVALAHQAGALTLHWFRDAELVVHTKDDLTPVTEADRAAERTLRTEIEARWPTDGIIGEEEAPRAGSSGRTWIVDPIDGTKAFTHGVPLYSNLLGASDEHGPLLGVINLPALGETVYAGRGLGCFIDGVPCRVSDHDRLVGAYLTTSAVESWPDATVAHAREAGAHVRTWGDGYGYALVATGRAEAMIDHRVEVWDLGPMPTVLTEAGGRLTDLDGTEGIEGGSGLGSNGHLHDDVLDLLARR